MALVTSLFFILKFMKSPEGFKMVGEGWWRGLAQPSDLILTDPLTRMWKMVRNYETFRGIQERDDQRLKDITGNREASERC